MWWSKSIEVNGIAGARYKSQNFSEGGYSDWRIPSIDELKTVYNTSSNFKYEAVDFIFLATPHLISRSLDDTDRQATSVKVLNYKNGRVENMFKKGVGQVSYLPVRRAH